MTPITHPELLAIANILFTLNELDQKEVSFGDVQLFDCNGDLLGNLENVGTADAMFRPIDTSD